MSRHEVRMALLDYAREYNAGALERRQSEVQALLEACRPDRSPMWRWAMFTSLAGAEARGGIPTRDQLLKSLTTVPGGGS